MKTLLSILLIVAGCFTLAGCDESGGGGGFVPTGDILAVAAIPGSNITIEVGGLVGSVPEGSAIEVTNLDTGETGASSGQGDESFPPITFTGSTDDEFNVIVTDGGTIVEDIVIGVTLLSDSVQQNLAQLGSIPTNIRIRDNRAYVTNGFSDNIQIFDLNQNPPSQAGTIVVPPGSNPYDIAFLDDTRAYVPNYSGQSVAVVNVQTRACEVLIVEAGHSGDTQPCQAVQVIAGNAFEEPAGITIADGKAFVSNNNFDPNFNPAGNGFITVLNTANNLLVTIIESSGANTGSMLLFEGSMYAVNGGATIYFPDSGVFTCNTEFPPSIDVINIQTNTVIDTIDIPLSAQNPLICLFNSLAATPDGLGYMGIGLVGSLLKVDLISGEVINGTDNPIVITDTTGLNSTSPVAIRDNLLFTTLFNTDQLAVLDTNNDRLDPFPYMAPFPAGIRAYDPSASLFDGVQSLAIRPGIPGVDFQGPDIFFITGISEQLGSVDTTLGLE
ncbi:MAG TPA: hypothetical protein PKC29_05660 [Thermodesulfobacteriota bacterium]|nr:hypothetical protein [Thermodesulfobacteriota bacterium]